MYYYEIVIEMPNRFYDIERPKKRKYSPESVLKIVKNAAKKAGILKTITPHIGSVTKVGEEFTVK